MIRPLAFVHYRIREDRVRVIDELAVMPTFRRQGLASRLMEQVGHPIEVKLPPTNVGGRAFLEALRFQPTHTLKTKRGPMIVYRLDYER